MHRRKLLRVALAAAVGATAKVGARDLDESPVDHSIQEVLHRFHCPDPRVRSLVSEVFTQCILGKIRPPEAPLNHCWIAPGGHYKGQWLWDTMFVVDLLSMLPGQEATIREVFQNYWDFQVRWNAVKPKLMHDMIPCAMRPGKDWIHEDHQFSQIPILAWGVERVYRRNKDKELLRQSLASLERFHEWYWRERDVTNVGLVAVGTYLAHRPISYPATSVGADPVQHARWETFDYSCDLDDLALTRHPTRNEDNEGPWYGDTLVVGNTAYLVMSERSLMRLAEIMGEKEMATRRKARIDKAVEAMRRHMWDEEAGVFLSLQRDTLKKVPGATIGSWMPLAAGVPTKAMAKRMAEVLSTPNWQTPLPVPTVDRRDSRWQAHGRFEATGITHLIAELPPAFYCLQFRL